MLRIHYSKCRKTVKNEEEVSSSCSHNFARLSCLSSCYIPFMKNTINSVSSFAFSWWRICDASSYLKMKLLEKLLLSRLTISGANEAGILCFTAVDPNTKCIISSSTRGPSIKLSVGAYAIILGNYFADILILLRISCIPPGMLLRSFRRFI